MLAGAAAVERRCRRAHLGRRPAPVARSRPPQQLALASWAPALDLRRPVAARHLTAARIRPARIRIPAPPTPATQRAPPPPPVSAARRLLARSRRRRTISSSSTLREAAPPPIRLRCLYLHRPAYRPVCMPCRRARRQRAPRPRFRRPRRRSQALDRRPRVAWKRGARPSRRQRLRLRHRVLPAMAVAAVVVLEVQVVAVVAVVVVRVRTTSGVSSTT